MALEKELRKNLKTARFNKGMTQENLAKEAGVKRSFIANIENYGHPKYLELKRICDALDVSATELLGF